MRKKQREGHTLVEAMFASTIGLIITGMIMILYIGGNQNMMMGVDLAETNSNGRLAMDWITKDIRWATRVDASKILSGTTYTTANDELVIMIPRIDSNGIIIDFTSLDRMAYYLDTSDPDNTKLKRIVDAKSSSSRSDDDRVIANYVESLVFKFDGVPLGEMTTSVSSATHVEIDLTINKISLAKLQNKSLARHNVSVHLNTTVLLRNKQ